MYNEWLKIHFWENKLDFPGEYLRMILGFVLALLLTFYLMPKIIFLAKKKRIIAEPNLRSSHSSQVPNLGGVAIFYAIATVGSLLAFELFERYKLFFASMIILFFIGLIDDLVDIKARTKLYAQIVASSIFVVGSDVRIASLDGLFGVYELSLFISIPLTVAYFIFMINAFNLIDGIDGLASGFVILACSVFGYIFVRLFDYPMAILCLVLVGSCLSFLYYNLQKKRKIFMGDTGSMILGFCLAFFSIRFMNLSELEYVSLDSGFVLALCIVTLPVLDTIQVLFSRAKNGKGLFRPDKNHLHHLLLKLNFTHKSASLALIFFQGTIITIAYIFRRLEIHYLTCIVLIYSVLFVVILRIKLNRIKR